MSSEHQARQQRMDDFLRSNRALQDVLDETMWTLDFQQVYRTVRDINVQLSRPLIEDLLQTETPSPPQSPKPHVSVLVLREAQKQKQTCPITLEPLKVKTSACVAPCYHVFQKAAIEQWLKQNKTCPQCRERCFL